MEVLAQDVATRTAEEVIRRLNLENRTGITIGVSEGDVDMPKRLRERIMLNGKERWAQLFLPGVLCVGRYVTVNAQSQC